MQKTRIFRALSFVTAFLLALSVILGTILERFRPQVDETLGTQSQILVSDITDTSQAAYPSAVSSSRKPTSVNCTKAGSTSISVIPTPVR